MQCIFRFKIYICLLFKININNSSASHHLFYLLMDMVCWLHVLFVLIFMIYLFTSSKWCQQQQRKSPPVFVYLLKLVVDYMWFSFEYSVFICLFIQSDVKKSSATHHLFLFTYWNWLLITWGFLLNIQYLFVYLFKAMSTKAAQVTTCFYLERGALKRHSA